MGNSSSSPKFTAQDRAIFDMKLQRDEIQKYQKRINTITERETEIARQCLAQGNKRRALLALRKKKYQQSLLEKTDQQLEQLERLTSDVEFAAVQKDVLFGLQQGSAVLKQIHKEMGGIEGVEKLLDENAEARQVEKEISDMLAGGLSNADEDEVDDELEAMERELLPKQPSNERVMPEAPVQEPMPDAPSEEIKETSSSTQNREERSRQRAKERKMEALAA